VTKMAYLAVRNWSNFQHYKDRNPLWIKLYTGLLDDYDFAQLGDGQKAQLILIWLLASKTDGVLPNDPAWIKRRIACSGSVAIPQFIKLGFLEERSQPESERRAVTDDGAPWGSRYVPASLRDTVMRRDEFKCRQCEAQDNLEIDHVVPVSAGGQPTEDNLQVLCRKCNRAKRARTNQPSATTNQTSAEPREEVTRREEKKREDVGRDSGGDAFESWRLRVPATHRDAIHAALRAAQNPDALRREFLGLEHPITGGPSFGPEVVGQAVHEMAVAGTKMSAKTLRAFCRRVGEPERPNAYAEYDQWSPEALAKIGEAA